MTHPAHTYDPLSCQELVELATDYLEDAMPSELRERFDSHIERCAGCRAYLEQMRETIRVTGELTPDSITPEAERALLDAFQDWSRE